MYDIYFTLRIKKGTNAMFACKIIINPSFRSKFCLYILTFELIICKIQK